MSPLHHFIPGAQGDVPLGKPSHCLTVFYLQLFSNAVFIWFIRLLMKSVFDGPTYNLVYLPDVVPGAVI